MKLSAKMAFAAMMAVLPTAQAGAQEEASDDVEAYVGTDIVSRYMWRGQDRGGVSIQPEAYVSWKGVTVKLNGNAGFDAADDRRIDVTLGYERYGFNIGVIDYWTSGVDKNNRYFFFEKTGAHQLEANIGYMCKYGSLQAYTMFWGNDFKIGGKQAYSTYVELSVPFKLGGVDWNVALAGTPFESAGYNEVTVSGNETHTVRNYFYADGPACVMAALRATKTLNLGKLHLPVYAELHTNPYLRTAAMLAGVTIVPF